MRIHREPLIIDSAYYAQDWDVPRAAGAHLMQIVDYMEGQLGIADPSRAKLPSEALEWYRFGGFLMEHAFARHAIEVECQRDPEGIQRPDPVMWCEQCDMVVFGGAEITLDHCLTYGHHGIHASPDAMLQREWRLKEWKCTWKSQNRAGGDRDDDREREHLTVGIWRWPVQTRAYCYLMGTKTAELWAMFVNSKYAPPVPSGDRFTIDYDTPELEGGWLSVVSYARKGGFL